MGEKRYERTFMVGVTAALFFGIFLRTGQNVDIVSISIESLNLIKNTIGDPNGTIANYINWFGWLGIALTFTDIIGIIFFKWSGIFSAILGYVGMLILVINVSSWNGAWILIGAILLIIGAIIALWVPDNSN